MHGNLESGEIERHVVTPWFLSILLGTFSWPVLWTVVYIGNLALTEGLL